MTSQLVASLDKKLLDGCPQLLARWKLTPRSLEEEPHGREITDTSNSPMMQRQSQIYCKMKYIFEILECVRCSHTSQVS
jgi:hypothetical protein